MSAPLCVAVVGTGSAGMRHLRILGRMNGVRALAITRRPERVRELEQGGYTAVSRIDTAAQMGATSCVVATDTGRHVEDGLAAVECGFDVLVEKPLAPCVQEALRLERAAVNTHRRLFVGCVMRFSESLATFQELLELVGRLHSVRIECQSYLPDWRPARPYRESYSARAEEGGVLRDLIHEIDYAGWIFGWPPALQANVKNLGRLGIEADEIAELMWEGSNGVVFSITLDYLSRPHRRRMKAMGERGTLEWDGIDKTVTLALADAPLRILRSSQTQEDAFVEQATAFVKTQRGQYDPRLATGEEGVKALAVCDAARRASACRREESVEYP